jgi:hypothetical protein
MITERDRQIVGTLLKKVRVVSLGQVVMTWWGGRTTPAARRLRRLEAGGWIIGERLLARPLLPLDAPLFVWAPGEPPPDCGHLSYRAQARWHVPAEPTLVWYAAPTAAARLGGHARGAVKNHCQVTHDLHVCELYLKLLRSGDPRAAAWVGEDVLTPGLLGPGVPDAVLMRRGKPVRVVEFGGAYPPNRFEKFHEYCALAQITYEIW